MQIREAESPPLTSFWCVSYTSHQLSPFGHCHRPVCFGYHLAAHSLSTEQSTHQIHIFPIWREGCCGRRCQRPYWSSDRWHQWLFPCPPTQLHAIVKNDKIGQEGPALRVAKGNALCILETKILKPSCRCITYLEDFKQLKKIFMCPLFIFFKWTW